MQVGVETGFIRIAQSFNTKNSVFIQKFTYIAFC